MMTEEENNDKVLSFVCPCKIFVNATTMLR